MFEYLVNKPNYCHMSALNYNTIERKAMIRMGRVVAASLVTLDCAGSGERGRADSSSSDLGDGNLVKCVLLVDLIRIIIVGANPHVPAVFQGLGPHSRAWIPG